MDRQATFVDTHALDGEIKYSSISVRCCRCNQRCNHVLKHSEKDVWASSKSPCLTRVLAFLNLWERSMTEFFALLGVVWTLNQKEKSVWQVCGDSPVMTNTNAIMTIKQGFCWRRQHLEWWLTSFILNSPGFMNSSTGPSFANWVLSTDLCRGGIFNQADPAL